MTTPLPRVHTAAEVAELLRETENYVLTKARSGEWPHRRGPRNAPRFTDSDVAAILELIAVPVQARPEPRVSWAPRSGRRAS